MVLLARVVVTTNVARRLLLMSVAFAEVVEFLRAHVIVVEMLSIARVSAEVVPLTWVAVVVRPVQVAVTINVVQAR